MEKSQAKVDVKQRAKYALVGTGVVLLVPLVAMLFTNDVKWGLFDFVIIGALLISASALYLYITTKLSPVSQTVATIIIVAVVMLLWGEMAVGIFGTPFAGS